MRGTIADVDTLIDMQNKTFLSDFIKYGECPGYGRSLVSKLQKNIMMEKLKLYFWQETCQMQNKFSLR